MGDFFNLLLFLEIIFVDDMLITYQLDEFTYDCFISMMESSWCQTDVVEAIGIDQFTILRLHSMGNAIKSSSAYNNIIR